MLSAIPPPPSPGNCYHTCLREKGHLNWRPLPLCDLCAVINNESMLVVLLQTGAQAAAIMLHIWQARRHFDLERFTVKELIVHVIVCTSSKPPQQLFKKNKKDNVSIAPLDNCLPVLVEKKTKSAAILGWLIFFGCFYTGTLVWKLVNNKTKKTKKAAPVPLTRRKKGAMMGARMNPFGENPTDIIALEWTEKWHLYSQMELDILPYAPHGRSDGMTALREGSRGGNGRIWSHLTALAEHGSVFPDVLGLHHWVQLWAASVKGFAKWNERRGEAKKWTGAKSHSRFRK